MSLVDGHLLDEAHPRHEVPVDARVVEGGVVEVRLELLLLYVAVGGHRRGRLLRHPLLFDVCDGYSPADGVGPLGGPEDSQVEGGGDGGPEAGIAEGVDEGDEYEQYLRKDGRVARNEEHLWAGYGGSMAARGLPPRLVKSIFSIRSSSSATRLAHPWH